MTNIAAVGVGDERIKVSHGGNALIPFTLEHARLMLQLITDHVKALRQKGDFQSVIEFEAMNCNFMAAQLMLLETKGGKR